jgi:hypothetical protein
MEAASSERASGSMTFLGWSGSGRRSTTETFVKLAFFIPGLGCITG